ncbi:hypothetical protein N7465_011760 [Penicillium sp. CMV-2018d]|nr:hypothetical protein N7465_011760 [Penicillium sp. CMV-2018d]
METWLHLRRMSGSRIGWCSSLSLTTSRWPADFNTDGDIFAERWPMEGAVVVWAHGLPFLPVFSDYYLLAGAGLRHYLWTMDKKHKHKALTSTRMHFGEAVASPADIGENALEMEHDEQDRQRFPAAPTLRCSPTNLVLLFGKDKFTLGSLPYIVGFHPNSGTKALKTVAQPDSISDDIWRKMELAPYARVSKIVYRSNRPGAEAVANLLRRHPLISTRSQRWKPRTAPTPSSKPAALQQTNLLPNVHQRRRQHRTQNGWHNRPHHPPLHGHHLIGQPPGFPPPQTFADSSEASCDT